LLFCSKNEEKTRERIIEACKPIQNNKSENSSSSKEGLVDEWAFQHVRANRQEILETFEENKATLLTKAFVENKIWQCPTLVPLQRKIGYDKPFVDQTPLKYFNQRLVPALESRIRKRWKSQYPSFLNLDKSLGLAVSIPWLRNRLPFHNFRC
jgi:hypothetical protein